MQRAARVAEEVEDLRVSWDERLRAARAVGQAQTASWAPNPEQEWGFRMIVNHRLTTIPAPPTDSLSSDASNRRKGTRLITNGVSKKYAEKKIPHELEEIFILTVLAAESPGFELGRLPRTLGQANRAVYADHVGRIVRGSVGCRKFEELGLLHFARYGVRARLPSSLGKNRRSVLPQLKLGSAVTRQAVERESMRKAR